MVEKNRYVKFFEFLWYVHTGEDSASQTRSVFDWYYPHLYNYSLQIIGLMCACTKVGTVINPGVVVECGVVTML